MIKNLAYYASREISITINLIITLSMWADFQWGQDFAFGPGYIALFFAETVLSLYCYVVGRISVNVADEVDLPRAGNWRIIFCTLELLILGFLVITRDTITLGGGFLHIVLAFRTLCAAVVVHRWYKQF